MMNLNLHQLQPPTPTFNSISIYQSSSPKPVLSLDSNSNWHSSSSDPSLNQNQDHIISPLTSIKTPTASSSSPIQQLTPSNLTKSFKSQSILGSHSCDSKRFQHRWSSGSHSISPKDAISLESSSPRLHHLSPLSPKAFIHPNTVLGPHPSSSSPHRRTHSGAPLLSSLLSPASKRISWNPTPNDPSTPVRNRAHFSWASPYVASSPEPAMPMTEDEIQSIESLGVKIVDCTSTSHLNHTSSPFLSTRPSRSTSINCKSPSHRNSIASAKRRRSLKLQSDGSNLSPLGPITGSLLSLPDRISNAATPIQPTPVNADQLIDLMNRAGRGKENDIHSSLLIIDLRSLPQYLGSEGRLKGSINVNFPSLLIKRFRKGHHGQFQLGSFITTEVGKRYYAKLEKTHRSRHETSQVLDEVDICVIDDDLASDENSRQKPKEAIGTILLDVLHQRKRINHGLYFLNESFKRFVDNPDAKRWLVTGECERNSYDSSEAFDMISPTDRSEQYEVSSGSGPQGLRRLQPSGPLKGSLPSIEKGPKLIIPETTSSASSSACDSSTSNTQSLRLMLGNKLTVQSSKKNKPPKLRRIDTSESSLSAPRSHHLNENGTSAASSSKLSSEGGYTRLSPNTGGSRLPSPLGAGVGARPVSCHTPRVDRTNLGVGRSSGFCFPPKNHTNSSPIQKRPFSHHTQPINRASSLSCTSIPASIFQHHPPSESSPTQVGKLVSPDSATQALSHQSNSRFKTSTIIPGFLYLGPEPIESEDYEKLNQMKIKRILNVAIEVESYKSNETDDHPNETEFIEKYMKISLRDFVEEVGVQDGIDLANKFLGKAIAKYF
ncbi:uncharacterized protein MELLADRAFT_78123 [Melampsora larici-populina 98AG31]|uniref:Rhodanese domain-containing protein n=1 Tax=Melampsora larici-populina (strain 98AG31 / pathotype 3-4-7) TaxID=747676 RepID=F4RQF1_MELLP|nr:uncharacterized protein MELLADRAFT_78123 [Melampsora larici-populina 98AG31]EGG05419.1 hypothetical protein MELLADRAFT_78123 [Melampsora larici-populina 98AG31]